jgi:hypothetical protein
MYQIIHGKYAGMKPSNSSQHTRPEFISFHTDYLNNLLFRTVSNDRNAISSGLNRVLRARCDDARWEEDFNIFKHRRFRPFQLVYDGYIKEKQYLMPATLGNQADHLNSGQLTELLSVLGASSPEQLLATLIFYTTYFSRTYYERY